MKHKKSHFLLWLSILSTFLLTSITIAQTSYLDSLDGKYALQFQITENFTISNFQGAILSGKYQLGKRSAIRLGVSLYFDDSNMDREATFIDTLIVQSNAQTNSIGFTINSQYIAYMVSTNDIGFYLGSGPEFSFANTDTEVYYSENDQDRNGNSSSDIYSIGLSGIAGVEWSFYKNMSLSAEYGIKFYYSHRNEKYSDEDKSDERTSESLKITPNYINFGITIYF